MKDHPAMKQSQAEAVVLKTLQEKLGGRVLYAGVGGAPVSKSLFQWIKKLFPMGAVESYGTTEVGGIYNNGVVRKDVQVKLVDWEDYTSKDLPFPRGEICVQTKTMFGGYYGDKDLTEASLVDGWYHTGDIGKLEPLADGTVKIALIDRKKNLFKLAQGEFVSPERLEGKYRESEFVDQVFIHGDGELSVLVALVNPNKQAVTRWLSANGESMDDAAKWLSNKKLNMAIWKDICEQGLKEHVPPFFNIFGPQFESDTRYDS